VMYTSPEMIKWSIWVPAAAFIAMQASLAQTGNVITGYKNELDQKLFLVRWVVLLVVGEILWQIFTNLEEILGRVGTLCSNILKLVWKMLRKMLLLAFDLCVIAASYVVARIVFLFADDKHPWFIYVFFGAMGLASGLFGVLYLGCRIIDLVTGGRIIDRIRDMKRVWKMLRLAGDLFIIAGILMAARIFFWFAYNGKDNKDLWFNYVFNVAIGLASGLFGVLYLVGRIIDLIIGERVMKLVRQAHAQRSGRAVDAGH